jgi:uncharacterized protein YdeI (YjbR/CyaY-like superfamily)
MSRWAWRSVSRKFEPISSNFRGFFSRGAVAPLGQNDIILLVFRTTRSHTSANCCKILNVMKSTELPTLPFENKKKWSDWLARQHARSAGVWMKLAKKDSGVPSLTYEEALDVALCYGWIDGQKKGFDDKYWLQKFTPRGPRSIWSKINTEKAERLIASGEMKPAGLKVIEAARQDGRWAAAYSSQKNMSVPEDFQAALAKNPKAKAFFTTLNSVNRYAILFRIQTAKKAETRLKRIQKFVDMLERGEKLY